MYIKINEYREVEKVGASGLQEENRVTILRFEFPGLIQGYNKYIEFETPDGSVFDVILKDVYELKNNITKYERVQVQIVAKKADMVWKSNSFSLRFGKSINASTEVTDEKIDGFNTLVDSLKVEMAEVTNLKSDVIAFIASLEERLRNGEFKGETGEGVIAGGKMGQVLGKGSDLDYDMAWKDVYTKDEIEAKRYLQDSDYVHTDNNYTTEEKEKLAGLSNYDDSGLRTLIDTKANITDLHAHANKDVLDKMTAFYTIEEKGKLAGLNNYDDSGLRTLIGTKANITDLHIHENKALLDKMTAFYTFEEKGKLEGLSNYDDTKVKQDIVNLENGKAGKIEMRQETNQTITIQPDCYYCFGELASLNIGLATITDSTVYHEYMFEFVSGNTPTTLTLPSTVKWIEMPQVKANKTYQCSIVNDIGVLLGV